ncbi:MAG: glycerophosphodiester phosphodiesterase [Cellulomonadaceae bacterium]|jgi:glycerophosphoryl diester phosphodiesterase|nr:glycerophosphodiester phosphodiesterase [Cellulomonadaceae bacterium]
MLIIAHRGNKNVAPENTLPAFEAAARAGAHMIETDIYPCKTGEIVIIHDEDVSHSTNGNGKITQLSFTEINQLDAGGNFSPAYQGTKIPTLEQLIEFFQRYPKLELLLEFKGIWSDQDAQRVATALNNANLRDRVIVESFEAETVKALQIVAPEFRRGLLIEHASIAQVNNVYGDPIQACHKLGAMCLNPSMELITENPELVTQAHEAGLQVLAWTGNQPAQWVQLLDLGAEGICTDRPEFLAGWLAGRAA